MGCGCEGRKEELAAAGRKPLVGKTYTPIDAAQWVLMRLERRVKGDD